MIRPLKILAAAGLLFASASFAGAAPANMAQVTHGLSNGLVQVHGGHRSCQRGRYGWHRHDRYGDRRECREWRGGYGRRPDSCVKVGPVWVCDN
jgi:hypothetical protein